MRLELNSRMTDGVIGQFFRWKFCLRYSNLVTCPKVHPRLKSLRLAADRVARHLGLDTKRLRHFNADKFIKPSRARAIYKDLTYMYLKE